MDTDHDAVGTGDRLPCAVLGAARGVLPAATTQGEGR